MNLLNHLRRLGSFFLGDPARRFASASAVLTLSLAIVLSSEFVNDWHSYQRQFLKLVRTRPDAAALERRFERGIHQIWIPEQGIVDRCTTCHLGLKEVALADVREQPFRPHPTIPHSLTEFGCVTCHRGQGAATTVEEAHASTKAWEQPLLPAKYLESSCGQCHLGPLEGTPKLNLGRRLLARYGCARCHSIPQPDGTAVVPADDPPPLRHIAEKTSREWLFAWVKNPQAYAATSTMPNLQLNDQQASDVASFLMAQSTPSGSAPAGDALEPTLLPVTIDASSSGKEEGASLYGSSFCATCHAAQNAAGNVVGGDLGPELTGIGGKVDAEWLRLWLKNPQAYDPRTRMPHYRFDDRQIALLSSYLLSKKGEGLLANVHLPTADAASVARGKNLVVEYGCAACHQINGVNAPQTFAPDLSRIGSKALAQIVFAPQMEKTLPDYISQKIRDPRSFGHGLKMPKYNFTNTQIEALTTALLAQTGRAWNEPKNLVRLAPRRSDYHPGGEGGRLIEDLRCQSCHAINGSGGGMAPDLTTEGSAVQRAWLEEFMRNPGTLRPALIRRMPKFNLTPGEIKTVADYMISAYQSPGFDPHTLDPHALTGDAAVRGKDLFYLKYACQSCHIADYNKDKGYVGPSLTAVGHRRPAVWIYNWLKNPQAVRPGTMMPNMRLSDNEARDLTAFLMTLTARENGAAQ